MQSLSHRMFWIWTGKQRKSWKVKTSITCRSRITIYYLKSESELCMYDIDYEKLLVIRIMVLKEEWITILPKFEVKYQRSKFPFMFLIAVKERANPYGRHFFIYTTCCP